MGLSLGYFLKSFLLCFWRVFAIWPNYGPADAASPLVPAPRYLHESGLPEFGRSVNPIQKTIYTSAVNSVYVPALGRH
jgi:hypothetical protein